MVSLIAQEGTLKDLSLHFEEGTAWILGRDPDEVDFVLEDPKVSRRHALCRMTDGGFEIENLSSSNPVRVNDREIHEPQLLQQGDKVTIGGTIFHYFEEKPTATLLQTKEEPSRDTIFEQTEEPMSKQEILLPGSRFIFKVVAGPNTGAEIALEPNRHYLIGTDTTSCDIIFYDLSVSREHARLTVHEDGTIDIEDLASRNGVVVDKQKIATRTTLLPGQLIALGTSIFLIIDREAPLKTILTPDFTQESREREEFFQEPLAEEIPEPEVEPTAVSQELLEKDKAAEERERQSQGIAPIAVGKLILGIVVIGFLALFGVAAISLFQSQKVPFKGVDQQGEIQHALAAFPAVRYTFCERDGKLIILGHVENAIEKNQFYCSLQALPFVRSIEDYVVNDEGIAQEMNILLAKNPNFQGVSISAVKAGHFVVAGHLATSKQYSQLIDFMNLNFNYMNQLEYCVIIDEEVVESVRSQLASANFGSVNAEFAAGQLILTGYVASGEGVRFNELISHFSVLPGVRAVRNHVVLLSPEQAVINLAERYPNRYRVSGYSKHGDVNVNVVVNGRLLMRGDKLDGMEVVSIQSDAIFFERDAVKYKLDFGATGLCGT